MTDSPSDTEDTGVIRLENADDFRQYGSELIAPALRYINILSLDLDKAWLGQDDMVEALKKAVLKNRRLTIRILTGDPGKAVKSRHPLIPLIRKLSRIEARVIEPEILEKQPAKHSFMLVDQRGIQVKQVSDEYIGFAHFDDKPNVKNYQDQFDQYWRFSFSHSDLRHVYV